MWCMREVNSQENSPELRAERHGIRCGIGWFGAAGARGCSRPRHQDAAEARLELRTDQNAALDLAVNSVCWGP